MTTRQGVRSATVVLVVVMVMMTSGVAAAAFGNGVAGRACPFATTDQASSLTGVGGLVLNQVLLQGDLVEGFEGGYPGTSCTWHSGLEWIVIGSVWRGPVVAMMWENSSGEFDREYYDIVPVSGPWDEGFTFEIGNAAEREVFGTWLNSQVYARGGELLVATQVIGPLQAEKNAVDLARHIWQAATDHPEAAPPPDTTEQGRLPLEDQQLWGGPVLNSTSIFEILLFVFKQSHEETREDKERWLMMRERAITSVWDQIALSIQGTPVLNSNSIFEILLLLLKESHQENREDKERWLMMRERAIASVWDQIAASTQAVPVLNSTHEILLWVQAQNNEEVRQDRERARETGLPAWLIKWDRTLPSVLDEVAPSTQIDQDFQAWDQMAAQQLQHLRAFLRTLKQVAWTRQASHPGL
jgi:hypothetical protein